MSVLALMQLAMRVPLLLKGGFETRELTTCRRWQQQHQGRRRALAKNSVVDILHTISAIPPARHCIGGVMAILYMFSVRRELTGVR